MNYKPEACGRKQRQKVSLGYVHSFSPQRVGEVLIASSSGCASAPSGHTLDINSFTRDHLVDQVRRVAAG